MAINNQTSMLSMIQDDLGKAVIVNCEANSTIFKALPWKQISGMGYSYGVIDSLMDTQFRLIGEEARVDAIAPIERHEALKVLSQDAVVDRALVTGQNIVDLRSTSTSVATVSLMNKFDISAIYGDGTKGSFVGLDGRIALGVGKAFVGVLDPKDVDTFDLLDEAIDFVTGDNTSKVIFCNKKQHRLISKAMRKCGIVQVGVSDFGAEAIMYNHIPIVVCEAIKDGDIFICRMSDVDGCCGITNQGIVTTDQGLQRTFYYTSIEGLVAIATLHDRCFAKIQAVATPVKAK